MRGKVLYLVLHYVEAVQLRIALILEALRATKRGLKIPRGGYWNIWREPHTHEEYLWLLRFVPNSQPVTVIDIGGNSGYWAAGLRKYYPNAKIYAFEPISDMYQTYGERFNGDENVRVYNTALGDRTEAKEINVSNGYVWSSFNKYGPDLESRNKEFERTEIVQVSMLDNFLSEISFGKTIVKVDVQGFEMEVIRGGASVFSKADVAIIECSFNNEYVGITPSFGEVVTLLRNVGLHPLRFGVYDKQRSPIAYERNVLFVRDQLLDQVWGYY